MTIFKTFFKVARKYIGSLIGYTAIFTILMLIMFNNGTVDQTTEFKSSEINLCIINHDNSEITDRFVDYLSSNHNLVDLEENEDTFRDSIYNRKVDYILIIPKGYGEDLMKDGIKELESYKLPGSFSGNFFEMDMNSFINTYKNYLAFGMTSTDAYKNTISTLSKEADATIYNEAKDHSDDNAHNFFTYLTYVMMSLLITGLAPIIIQFNQSDVRKRTICGPIGVFKRNMALACGSGVYTLLLFVFFTILAFFLCGNSLLSMTGLVRIGNGLLYTMVCLAVAFLLSSFSTKTNTLNMYANIIGLGSSFLCGVFVPRALLGEGVLRIGRFLPAYWYINIETELHQNGFVMNQTVLTGFLVEALFFVALMLISVVIVKIRKK